MNRSEIKSTLTAARALIATPDKWTQGANEKDAAGNDLENSNDADVASRCAVGAVLGVYDENIRLGLMSELGSKSILDCLRHAVERHTGKAQFSVADWNDAPARTHADIMQGFDWAIADAGQEEVTA